MTTSGRRGRAGLAAAAMLATLGLASCSSSGGSSGTTGSTAGGTGSTAGGTGSAATIPGGSATTAIKNAYAKFFAPDTPENVSLGLLQNGQKFKATIEQQAKGSMAASASVKVSSVKQVSANTAQVKFTIYVNKQAMLQNQTGYAVRTNGTWQVAEFTFCQLLTLEGSAPAECKTPTATQTPA